MLQYVYTDIIMFLYYNHSYIDVVVGEGIAPITGIIELCLA